MSVAGGAFGEDVTVIEAKVTYTTKELLQGIYDRFDHLELVAESAASRESVDRVANRVDKLEREAEGTKAVASALLAAGKARWTRNEKLAALVFAAVALAPSIQSIVNLFNG